MAVFRVEKTMGYTVMSNYHLRDKNLSCKACGLLSKMLSLPDEWDYTTRGLAMICKDGVQSIHDRMPLILRKEQIPEWLAPDCDPEKMVRHTIHDLVVEKAVG